MSQRPFLRYFGEERGCVLPLTDLPKIFDPRFGLMTSAKEISRQPHIDSVVRLLAVTLRHIYKEKGAS